MLLLSYNLSSSSRVPFQALFPHPKKIVLKAQHLLAQDILTLQTSPYELYFVTKQTIYKYIPHCISRHLILLQPATKRNIINMKFIELSSSLSKQLTKRQRSLEEIRAAVECTSHHFLTIPKIIKP